MTAETMLKANRDEILAELTSLRTLLREKTGNGADSLTDTESVLGIMRLCPGLSLDLWPQLAEEYGLRNWLALPLEGDEFPFLEQIQNSLEELAYQTEHDPLTTLCNRRAFDRLLEQEFERASRSGESLTVAMLDLDHFKKVNDTYGHACGDEVLVQVARVLLTQTRRYDIAARMGGEEFALILPGAGLIRARAMLQRMLDAVRDLSFTCPDADSLFHVTMSAGLVCRKRFSESEPADLLKLADESLYQAKEEGRDRVIAAPISDVATPAKESLVHSQEKKFLFTGS